MNTINPGLSISRKRHKEAGFSLVELSAIIAISATLAMGYISWTMPAGHNDALKSRETYEHMQQINDAIETFVITNRRLPCPANPLLNSQRHTNTNTGASNLYDFDDEAVTIDKNGVRCPVSIGAVPTRALGLPSELMFDGWGRKLHYHVAPDLCGSADCSTRSYKQGVSEGNGINVIQSVADSSATPLASDAAFIVLSYGANGMGAYLPSGSRTPLDAMGDDEWENMNNEYTQNNGDNTYVKHAASSDYDDLALYRSKAQIDSLATAIVPASFAACSSNSSALSKMDRTVAHDFKTYVPSLQVVDGATIYNKGDTAILEVMWDLQEACYALYGSSLARLCPVGQTYNQNTNTCTCPKGQWMATGC